MSDRAPVPFKARAFGAIVADLKISMEIGPTPEFLALLIEQQKQRVRSAARRNDPDSPVVSYEVLRDQLKFMEALLPVQREKWTLIRAADLKSRLERMQARHDPAERAAEIAAINARFGAGRPQSWQDNMTGVADPDRPTHPA